MRGCQFVARLAVANFLPNATVEVEVAFLRGAVSDDCDEGRWSVFLWRCHLVMGNWLIDVRGMGWLTLGILLIASSFGREGGKSAT